MESLEAADCSSVPLMCLMMLDKRLNLSSLMVSGAWAACGPWSSCSRDCELGFRVRKRTCTNPEPRNGGLPCVGDAAEYQDCNPHACPGNPPPRNLAQGTPRPGNSQAYPGLSSSVETTPPRPLCTRGPKAISLALKMDTAGTRHFLTLCSAIFSSLMG